MSNINLSDIFNKQLGLGMLVGFGVGVTYGRKMIVKLLKKKPVNSSSKDNKDKTEVKDNENSKKNTNIEENITSDMVLNGTQDTQAGMFKYLNEMLPISILTLGTRSYFDEKTSIDPSLFTQPVDVCQIFRQNGFVFVKNNLGNSIKNLSNFTNLMRKTDINDLNGCEDPENCKCTFRHKHCKLFMIRKCIKNNLTERVEYFSPGCNGVKKIEGINDVNNELLKEFETNYSDDINIILNYVNFVIEPSMTKTKNYIADMILVADPVHLYSTMCNLKWHQDMYNVNDKPHLYDYVALFVLNTTDITSHKILIGSLDNKLDINNKSDIDSIQKDVIINESIDVKCGLTTSLNTKGTSNVGYIIDQRKGFLHKHTDYKNLSENSRRDIIAIRIKHIEPSE